MAILPPERKKSIGCKPVCAENLNPDVMMMKPADWLQIGNSRTVWTENLIRID
jgi:hypothetical protein